MNYMKQVAEMLGVELNETFKVNKCICTYKFTDNGLVDVTHNTSFFGGDYVLYMLLTGEWKIVKPTLDKKEKEYLENLLRPFKDRVVYIHKTDRVGGEWIAIFLEDNDLISLPCFKEGTMYKGMKLDKQYTLKELGLFENE